MSGTGSSSKSAQQQQQKQLHSLPESSVTEPITVDTKQYHLHQRSSSASPHVCGQGTPACLGGPKCNSAQCSPALAESNSNKTLSSNESTKSLGSTPPRSACLPLRRIGITQAPAGALRRMSMPGNTGGLPLIRQGETLILPRKGSDTTADELLIGVVSKHNYDS